MDCYIRHLTPEQAKTLAPELLEIDPDIKLWALFAENGELILLTDNRSSTFFKAAEDDMTVKMRH